MAIEFTQYILPRGRKEPVSIDRPSDIEALADKFIASGGWYEAEILTTGHVSLTACAHVNDEPQDIEIEVCSNNDAVPEAVDRLVRKSIAWRERTA